MKFIAIVILVNKNFMILGIASIFVLAVIATPQVFAGADNTGFPSWGGPSDIIPPEDGFVSSAAVDVHTAHRTLLLALVIAISYQIVVIRTHRGLPPSVCPLYFGFTR